MSYNGNDYQNYSDDTRESEAMRKMFVGGLNRDTTEETFYNYFSQFGPTEDKVIITDPHTHQSRGFGFVTFEKSESVENVFSSRPHIIDGKTVDVKRAMPREINTPGAHIKTTKLFVSGFRGIDLEPAELQDYIEKRHDTKFGRIEKIDLLKDRETGQLKGFGFIECNDSDFADRLCISETSFELKGRTLSIKKAEPQNNAGGNTGGGGHQNVGGGGPMRVGRGGGPMRGGSGGGRGGSSGRGGSGPRGGGGPRGGSRGGYNQNSGYQSNNYASDDNYSTSYPGYNQNQGGYQQGGYQQQSYQPPQYGGYQQNYQQSSGGYGQQNASYGQPPGGYNQGPSYGQGGYPSRGGNQQRYQPY
ncbi:heterogeneous nuclear ribonucleoprotein A0 isoform X1 [Hydra vulgaris]|uniref:Heterogeneous nuclear ribonucleoprotein A0 isoform X1 n=1 Tax=Hydra vulgaris TaxID=6087 RepID=A0ABM4BDE1_HYDVU